MRVAGTRVDGALWVTLDGGLSVILRGDTCSPAVDPSEAEKLGPWGDAHGVSGQDRRELARRLDRAATRPLTSFVLNRSVKVSATQGKKKMKFEYQVTGDEDEKVIGDAPAAEPVDEQATAEKKEEEEEEDPAVEKAKS